MFAPLLLPFLTPPSVVGQSGRGLGTLYQEEIKQTSGE